MVLTAGWSLVAVAAWVRWRRAAAVGASPGAIAEAAQDPARGDAGRGAS
jgi:hypothetical protein